MSFQLFTVCEADAPKIKCPVSLPGEGCMNELAAQGLIGSIRARFTDVVDPHICFHTVPYSKNHHNVLGTYITMHFHKLLNYRTRVF